MSAWSAAQAALLLAACATDEEMVLVNRELRSTQIGGDMSALEIVALVQGAVEAVRRVHGVPPEAAARFDPAIVPRLTLDEFVVHWPASGDATPTLLHDPCGEVLCDIDEGDPLGVLSSTALAHRCADRPTNPPTTEENHD